MASIISSATVATVSLANPAQASMVAPFTGLKSGSAFPVTRKSADITSVATNGGRVRCMQVWPPFGKKKFETLSYLPTMTQEQLAKQIAYLLRKGWIACVEFETEDGFVYREHHLSPGYYDGRYWTMWKLPMYGCTDPYQVLKEVEECRKAYKDAFIRIIGFDNVRQVQCISFIACKPPGCDENGPNEARTERRKAPMGKVLDKHSWAKAWYGAKSFDPNPTPPTRPDTTYL